MKKRIGSNACIGKDIAMLLGYIVFCVVFMKRSNRLSLLWVHLNLRGFRLSGRETPLAFIVFLGSFLCQQLRCNEHFLDFVGTVVNFDDLGIAL